MDFEQLKKEGKTVIYKSEYSDVFEKGWELWGKKKTNEKEVYIYRKIVTFEEAEQFELEKQLLP